MQKWSLFDVICLQTINCIILKVVIMLETSFVMKTIIAICSE